MHGYGREQSLLLLNCSHHSSKSSTFHKAAVSSFVGLCQVL